MAGRTAFVSILTITGRFGCPRGSSERRNRLRIHPWARLRVTVPRAFDTAWSSDLAQRPGPATRPCSDRKK